MSDLKPYYANNFIESLGSVGLFVSLMQYKNVLISRLSVKPYVHYQRR